ncbi:MAG: hypothetical protein U5J63_14975 [Fodinibius sp.]|nr:hypothetical protein [Fodinibius sp.]
MPGTHGEKAQLEEINQKLLATLRGEGVYAIGFVNESKLYRGGQLDNQLVEYLYPVG